MDTKYATLSNGVNIPILGFGTYEIEDNQLVAELVEEALKVGYRHIDTASIYKNEQGIGQGLKKSDIPRKEIFVTSKLWNPKQGYDSTLREFDLSLEKLQIDYMDLYLIHWPKGELSKESWRAIERIYKEGRVRAIGVSNFQIYHLEDLFTACEIKPMINQIELHPYLTQQPLRDFCKKHNILVEAWSPLMRGGIFEIPLLQQLSEKYNRTIAQIVLKWDVQLDIATIPKSVRVDRIKENFQIFDFELSDGDVLAISALNIDKRIGPDPDNFNF
ncbi:MAG: aldo/keto reductase [Bacteroidales bacterium]|jgi:diketogulonate reductase-like aldo/keto reductase|nr:aldo/keto reductase [Bacteroidales bacterium]